MYILTFTSGEMTSNRLIMKSFNEKNVYFCYSKLSLLDGTTLARNIRAGVVLSLR